MTPSVLLLVLACISLETVEQILYRMTGRSNNRWLRFMIPAVVLHVMGLTLWYFLLHALPLGIALPLMGAQYVTVAFAGKLLFREEVDMQRWIGIATIVTGFILIAVNEH